MDSSISQVEQKFLSAMADHGLAIDQYPVADGTLHRFKVPGDKSGTKNGWYTLFTDGTPAGIFGSWKSGATHTWCAVDSSRLDYAEQLKLKTRMAEARRQRDQAKAAGQQTAAAEAQALWSNSKPAAHDHPYLMNKRIQPHTLRQDGDCLLVPMRIDGRLVNVQRITPDGGKFFHRGARVTGAYAAIGSKLTESLWICEGFATGATLHQVMGVSVAAAMNAGNLIHVAQHFRQRYPDIQIVIACDNDTNTDGNPGVTKGTAAANAVGGEIAVPDMAGDFNDQALARELL